MRDSGRTGTVPYKPRAIRFASRSRAGDYLGGVVPAKRVSLRPLDSITGSEILDHPPSRVMTSVDEGGIKSAASKLNRSRKFLRDSKMFFRNAPSAALAIIGSTRPR